MTQRLMLNHQSQKFPICPNFPVSELLHMENEIAGMYLSGHPLDEYTTFSKAIHADKTGDISIMTAVCILTEKVSLVCIVAKLKISLQKITGLWLLSMPRTDTECLKS